MRRSSISDIGFKEKAILLLLAPSGHSMAEVYCHFDSLPKVFPLLLTRIEMHWFTRAGEHPYFDRPFYINKNLPLLFVLRSRERGASGTNMKGMKHHWFPTGHEYTIRLPLILDSILVMQQPTIFWRRTLVGVEKTIWRWITSSRHSYWIISSTNLVGKEGSDTCFKVPTRDSYRHK